MEKLDKSSDRVCHACTRKTRNAFELHNFIYSNLQKEKQAAFEVSDDSSDRSAQTRKGHKSSNDNSRSTTVKFSDIISEIWSSMMPFNSEITIILALVDGNSCLVSANSETG